MTTLTVCQREEELPNDIGEAFIEIGRRTEACGDGYPFTIGNDGNTIHKNSLNENSAYLIYHYLLLCTRLNMSNNNFHANEDGSLLFEEVAAEISRNYVGPRAESMVFGTATGGTGFRDKVNDLCSRLGEGDGYVNRTTARSTEKDGKLDVVVWKHFSDHLAGKFIAFGQCKTGTNYRDTLTQLQPDSFCRKWMSSPLALTPIRMFFVAEALPRSNWYNSASDAGLLFDRCRIVDFSSDVSEQVLKKISNWTTAAASSSDLPVAIAP